MTGVTCQLTGCIYTNARTGKPEYLEDLPHLSPLHLNLGLAVPQPWGKAHTQLMMEALGYNTNCLSLLIVRNAGIYLLITRSNQGQDSLISKRSRVYSRHYQDIILSDNCQYLLPISLINLWNLAELQCAINKVFLDFKLLPRSEWCILSFGLFPGTQNSYAGKSP